MAKRVLCCSLGDLQESATSETPAADGTLDENGDGTVTLVLGIIG